MMVLYAPRAPAVDTGGLPLDKVAHVAAFALPTAALILAGAPRGWVIGLMALHAPLSELLQHLLLADRSGDPGDVLADLAGVVLGAWWATRAAVRRGAVPATRR
jgi:VanZ family protein